MCKGEHGFEKQPLLIFKRAFEELYFYHKEVRGAHMLFGLSYLLHGLTFHQLNKELLDS